MKIELPYGKTKLSAELPSERVAAMLHSRLADLEPCAPAETLVEQALANPIGSPPLWELARGKKRVVLLASDHTRPVPSRVIVPAMLREVRRGNPQAEITILVATGCHRGSTAAELEQKFGPELCASERILVHDCARDPMVDLGTLPSGAPLEVNQVAAQADLLIAEGFIEPHFFAGFSGGRKSVLPGVCSSRTVYANHCAALIGDPHARSGCLEGNPVHRDMVEGARRAGLRFIVNVACNGRKQVVAAFAGELEKAHLAGVEFLHGACRLEMEQPAGIVITGNGGYPLDQNIYQAVKGMSTADIVCREGGVIIMASACADGHGGESFYRTFAGGETAGEILERIERTPMEETTPDQWQAQILARVMAKHPVVLVSDQPPGLVRRMGLIPAATLPEAVELADGILGRREQIVVIPDGVACIPGLKR